MWNLFDQLIRPFMKYSISFWYKKRAKFKRKVKKKKKNLREQTNILKYVSPKNVIKKEFFFFFA